MKKILSVLLAAVMVLGLLAGCADKPTETNNPPASNPPASQPADDSSEPAGKQYDGVELTMWSMWSSGEPQANVIEAAKAAFEEQTGAKITIEFKGRDVNKVLAASLEAQDNIDIIEDDYKRIGTVYNKFTYDLTEMAKAANYDSFSYKCFNDQSIAWAGYLNAITEQPNIGGIFYDKDAFENAGITAEPKTWAEFLDACQKLKDAGVGPLAQDSAYCDFAFYHTLVRYLGEAKIEELTMNGGWSGTAAEQAAQDIIDLRNAGYLADGAPDEFPSSQNKIGFGQAAMVICADYVTAEVNGNTGTQVNWGLFNYPAVDGGADNGAAYMGANSLAITSYSKNPQAAFDFILFLTTGEYGQKLADEAHQIPADSRNTAPADLNGTIETLQAAVSPMTWCASLSVNADLKDTIKSMCTELFEGKYADGAAFCAALDALY
ncbi:MAG: carbohydrate ABC transporter substrate-binding protein [Oscillospiraceae bacterium]|jgi:raffinose/stachyose/melibiose transport system substrate-binding protein|nr:carbohydrate ABC transporter substrate-binding protein [Oscillospiraceae bacterium]